MPTRIVSNVRTTLEMIKIEHTLFALPFAFLGSVLAARGIPTAWQIVWIIVAMVGARSTAMAFNRIADREYDARNPRTFVRGLRASYSRSAIRLKAIAVERAPTIATIIQTICHAVGIPRAANTEPRNANGSANSVCSILIISSVVRTLLTIRVGILDCLFGY